MQRELARIEALVQRLVEAQGRAQMQPTGKITPQEFDSIAAEPSQAKSSVTSLDE